MKEAQLKQLIVIVFFLLVFSVVVIALNVTGVDGVNNLKSDLAAIVGGKNIFSDSYTVKYLDHHRNLSDVEFKEVSDEGSSASLKKGNAEGKIEGFVLDGKKYAVHLVGCDHEGDTCNIRVNGMLVKDIPADQETIIPLAGDHKIVVKKIELDYCDEREVCDYMFQAYDRVDVEVLG